MLEVRLMQGHIPEVVHEACKVSCFARNPEQPLALLIIYACLIIVAKNAGHFAQISHDLAAERGIKNGDMITVMTPRGKIHLRALVTERFRPFMIDGKKVHHIGIPWHWGWLGVMPSAVGDVTNDLVASIGDPTTYIQESKALLCDVKKGEV